MPRGIPMPFSEFMGKMERYYPRLGIHRKYTIHIDPIFCEGCVYEMARASDRVRYMGKTLMTPSQAVDTKMEEVFRGNADWEPVLNEDRTVRALVSRETGASIIPSDDGREWTTQLSCTMP